MSANPGWLTALIENQPLLWGLAVVFYGIGDTVTTALGLRADHTAEVGPVALVVIGDAGILGLVLLKLVFFAIFAAIWYVLETPGRVAIPAAVAVAGIGVTLWNTAMLLAG